MYHKVPLQEPIYLTAYSSSYSKIIEHPLSLQGFKDDHFIKLIFDPSQEKAEDQAIEELEKVM